MARLDFGLMLRQNDPGHSLQELMTFNTACIERLSPQFSTLWLEDHLQVGETEALECLTTLSYLAAAYHRFTVGSLVLSQSYRNPALLAKMIANLAALTGGRVILGLGAGWKEEEYLSYGYPFPSTGTRMKQLEEAIEVIRALWGEQPATYEGRYYQVRSAYCAPTASVPLLIGGGGEQRTLAIVARYADWWNFNSVPVEQYAHKLSVLKEHCERIGRDISTLKLTYLGTISVANDPAKVQRNPAKHYIAGSPAQVIEELEQFSALGVTHCMFRVLDLESLELFGAQVAPHFA